ncbi:MAG: SAM-dependent chlorinase/fluorinase [Deltaproteobacteria bacterium]|nr:SAM-dependent chlorinase/fluorinase [Deltaproteobacteria bacterium]
MKRSGLITLLTDFGLEDPYAGMMKGVILAVNPDARIIDISHHIKAGSITRAAGMIRETYPYFPEGTVHVTVVDPGVGGKRRAIILMAQSHLFVGPDNGIFWPIINLHQDIKIIHITETKYFLPDVSNTFHGRDIFAPVAAHLSKGADPLEMGPTISDPVKLPLPASHQKGGTLYGQVVSVDHFGNLITNIHRKEIEEFAGDRTLVIWLQDLLIEGMRGTSWPR